MRDQRPDRLQSALADRYAIERELGRGGMPTPTQVPGHRGIIAGVVGSMLEWYNFALFGFFAQQIGAHFFPADDPTASLLAAFGTFAAGFIMRPLGAPSSAGWATGSAASRR